ncbi:hypothetical protein FDB42_08175 [Clostridium botulinum]|nr:hypothetical protein [Clostridium botulinum]
MDIKPLAKDLWAGVGGHFDSISQIIDEFIDNSISNLEAYKMLNRTINITINKRYDNLGNEKVIISVEDAGTGINNLESALKFGDKSYQHTPLNEHGFGFKHALASANPENDSWKVLTRTKEDFEKGVYKKVTSPYDFKMKEEIISVEENPWTGIFNSSGTIFEFMCSMELFNTIQKGIKGKAGFYACLEYLREELGYIYSGVIEKGKVSINIISTTIEGKNSYYNNTVESVKPHWNGYYYPKQDTRELDLGGGMIKVEYSFGEIIKSNYSKYYKRNISTSGVEIRINGRVLMTNIFEGIWGLEPHPSYNHFLVIINLISDSKKALPKTRTSKNGIRSGDNKLGKLYEWIISTHSTPPKQLADAVCEKELVQEIAKSKEQHIRNKDRSIECEFKVFKTINSPVSVDLYVFDGQDVVIYEAKKDKADIQSIYQLLLYWDGAVQDGIKPTEGVLLSSSFSHGVDKILKLINSKKDANGNYYNLIKKTWKYEGINYPRE